MDTQPASAGTPEDAALALFHRTAGTVPAYRKFLRDSGVDPEAVHTFADFQNVPLTSKDNYHRRNPLADLCRGGRLEDCDMIAVSSGSTGEPTFWPRSSPDEQPVVARFEQIFRDSFRADTRRTLAVVCFALGTWVGGMYTTGCCRQLAAMGYPITTIAPGNNAEEILRIVPALGVHFDQVVLLGYPPFLKGVIDTGLARGVPWPRYGIKLVTAGEVFSEEWRALVGRRAGMDDPCRDSATLYGTADGGTLGNETPLSIRIRRFLAGHPDAAAALFGEPRLPTLVQYDPYTRFFETRDGTLLFSADGGIPLVRYHIGDEGGLLGHDDMLEFLAGHGFDPVAETLRTGDRGVHPLPFAYVFGRSHFTVSIFGANVYPENVTVGLEQPEVNESVTGKFVMEVRDDADHDPYLAIAVELAPSVPADPGLRERVASSVAAQLRRLNSEYAHYVPERDQTPRVTLLPTGDPEYFPAGVKHRYTRAP